MVRAMALHWADERGTGGIWAGAVVFLISDVEVRLHWWKPLILKRDGIFGTNCEEENSTEGLAFQKDDDKSKEV